MIHLVLLANPATLFYASPFDGRVTEYEPLQATEAVKLAKAGVVSRFEAEQVLKFFQPDRSAPLEKGGIRLVLKSQGKTLFVDLQGLARIDQQRGYFDVLGYEKFVRAVPGRSKRLASSPLIRFRLENRSSESVTLEPFNGFGKQTIPPHQVRTMTTWFVPHRLLVSGKVISEIPASFGWAKPKRMFGKVLVSFPKDAFVSSTKHEGWLRKDVTVDGLVRD